MKTAVKIVSNAQVQQCAQIASKAIPSPLPSPVKVAVMDAKSVQQKLQPNVRSVNFPTS